MCRSAEVTILDVVKLLVDRVQVDELHWSADTDSLLIRVMQQMLNHVRAFTVRSEEDSVSSNQPNSAHKNHLSGYSTDSALSSEAAQAIFALTALQTVLHAGSTASGENRLQHLLVR